MLDRMSDTSRIVDKLYTKKLLERNECPNDRRSVNVIISDKGLELLKSLDYIDEISKQSLKSLTTAEINTLNELLDKLRD
jgi:DNA-binding MarR family transcriptional regulator